jgi:hypothetical protein
MPLPINSTSTAGEAGRVVKAAPGRVYRFSAYNDNAATRFIQLHDATSAPADTAVPVFVIQVATKTTVTVDFGRYGRLFSTGIYICNSTTGTTKTLGGTDNLFDVGFE